MLARSGVRSDVPGKISHDVSRLLLPGAREHRAAFEHASDDPHNSAHDSPIIQPASTSVG